MYATVAVHGETMTAVLYKYAVLAPIGSPYLPLCFSLTLPLSHFLLPSLFFLPILSRFFSLFLCFWIPLQSSGTRRGSSFLSPIPLSLSLSLSRSPICLSLDGKASLGDPVRCEQRAEEDFIYQCFLRNQSKRIGEWKPSPRASAYQRNGWEHTHASLTHIQPHAHLHSYIYIRVIFRSYSNLERLIVRANKKAETTR